MRLNMLGSGGVMPIPRPTCTCAICVQAREKGIPYSRTTCSLFVEGINLLFDMGEDSKEQLNRERITKVDYVILTHWHPDHTHGLRTLEQLNRDFEYKKPRGEPIHVYISSTQKDMLTKLSCGSFLDYYAKKGIIQLHDLAHEKQIVIQDISIIPYYIEKTQAFYFLIKQGEKHVIYAMCEYDELKIYDTIPPVDIYIAHNLFWENPDVSPRKIPPVDEDTFEKMLQDADKVHSKEIILTHIEESFQLDHDAMKQKMKQYYPEHNITVGYDGMIINL